MVEHLALQEHHEERSRRVRWTGGGKFSGIRAGDYRDIAEWVGRADRRGRIRLFHIDRKRPAQSIERPLGEAIRRVMHNEDVQRSVDHGDAASGAGEAGGVSAPSAHGKRRKSSIARMLGVASY